MPLMFVVNIGAGLREGLDRAPYRYAMRSIVGGLA